MSHPHILDGFPALVRAMEHGLGEIQALCDWLSMLGTGVISWHNHAGTLVTSLLGVYHQLDAIRCPCLNRQGVTESRAKEMGLWSYPIPEGGRRMTLIELSIKMSKTATTKSCTFHADWKILEDLYFSRGEKMKILPRGLPILLSITMAVTSWLRLVNIVNRSRPRLTSSLLKKQARHQCDVCTPSSDCLVVYNQFVTQKKCMAATVSKFLRSRQENINNWKFESSWYEQYKRRPFCLNFWSL